jgi:hypothetical protein
MRQDPDFFFSLAKLRSLCKKVINQSMRHFVRFTIIFMIAVDGQFIAIPSISLFCVFTFGDPSNMTDHDFGSES